MVGVTEDDWSLWPLMHRVLWQKFIPYPYKNLFLDGATEMSVKEEKAKRDVEEQVMVEADDKASPSKNEGEMDKNKSRSSPCDSELGILTATQVTRSETEESGGSDQSKRRARRDLPSFNPIHEFNIPVILGEYFELLQGSVNLTQGFKREFVKIAFEAEIRVMESQVHWEHEKEMKLIQLQHIKDMELLRLKQNSKKGGH
jgi:hypothetical protein